MGYTTDFDGSVTIEPALNEHELSFLRDFAGTRRMHRRKGPLYAHDDGAFGQRSTTDVLDQNRPDPDQPGLWCQWVPNEDGTELEWDSGEKFYNSAEWMKYLVENLLAPSAAVYLKKHMGEDSRLQHFTANHVVNGTIDAFGEDPGDRWSLIVENNVVSVSDYSMVLGPKRTV